MQKELRLSPRGAPKGNKNALKHGFYSRNFGQAEIKDLDVLVDSDTSLLSEIAGLRVAARRMTEVLTADQIEGESIDWISVLGALGLAYARIAGLLKTQKLLEGDQGAAVTETISQALTEITRELRLDANH